MEKLKKHKGPVRAKIWDCGELKDLIKKKIDATVKDVELAKQLEHALGDEVAYDTGGSGNVGLA